MEVSLVYWYLLFAVTTSFASMYELFIPVMQELSKLNPDNNVVRYRTITYITFFLLAIMCAPLILPSCIVPSIGSRFRESLMKSLA